MTSQRTAIWALTTTALFAFALPSSAQPGSQRDYDLAEQDLGTALRTLASQSGEQLVVSTDLVAGLHAPALRGRYSFEAALAELLRGTGLTTSRVGGVLIVQRALASDPDEPAEVLVTGTRIRGKGPVGSELVVIDRRAIEQGGFTTAQQIAQSIPQNYLGGANENTATATTGVGGGNAARGAGVNLRGLGQSSTLLLLNGDRPPLGGGTGTFADLSMIPASAIERVEIVPDGASAIYGSDAVAGVVNIIPRLNFTGAESTVRIGTADGDAQEYLASQLLGTRWSGGHAMIAYEFYKRDALHAGDRAYANDDLRAFGGPDRRVAYASPGTIYAGGKTFAIPAGQNGVGLTAAQLTAGTVNTGNSQYMTDLLPDQRRHSVFAAVSQDLLPHLRIYAHGLLSIRNFDQAIRSSADTRRTVPVTNPFYVDPIGTHQAVGVQYSFVRDLGAERYRGKVTAYGGTAGIAGELGSWSFDAHGTWGRQAEHYDDINRVNTARLNAALADSNPATAYNLFGDGPSTNPATIAKVRGSVSTDYDGIVWSLTTRADGPLFVLPAGKVRLAFGGDYRQSRYRSGTGISDVSSLTPVPLAVTPLPGARKIKAAFGELLVPLFGGDTTIPLLHRLDLSFAVRAENYSDFGSTTNPKLGASWEPFAGLTIRGSYGKSFRAPLSQEQRQDPGSMAIFAYSVPDPQSATGASNIIVIRGNDPNLRPERAKTWSLGAELKPSVVPGFHASVTYFNVVYRDRIASIASQLTSFLVNRSVYAPVTESNPSAARVAALFASPIYLDLAGIPSTAPIVAVVDARTQNLAVLKQNGIDFEVGYGFGAAGGRADIGVVGTHIFHIRQGLTATAPLTNVLDTTGNPVDLHLRGRAAWSSARWDLAAFVNYVGPYTNKTVSPAARVSSWTTVDLNIGYKFGQASGLLKGVRLTFNASNLFDRDPPPVSYIVGTATNGYDPENASPIGRLVSLQVSKAW
ncbi:TonB-dependent receptor [Sphingomonas sp. RT2P30]|uniref:TonB-dependent receptor n=1 Tax=Parasphingomonas halimpatiens TaxID=3096162 RepID=UPI002FC94AB8